jgi:hypothetical protein
MNPEDLSKKLAEIKCLEQFFKLAETLRHYSQQELFSVLFTIASDCTTYPLPAYTFAADLLLFLEPRCPLKCREAIEQLGRGHFEASLKRLPFYLVAQFGRPQVSKAAEALLAETDLSQETRQAATLVKYWAQYPASTLVGFPWHKWEPPNTALEPTPTAS